MWAQKESPDEVLDVLFRKESKARVVAERLLTGKPQSRAELVKGLDLSLTTVPRVVEALTSAGIGVERFTTRSRQAVYRVVGSPLNTANDDVVARYVHAAGEPVRVKVTKVEVIDGAVWVEWTRERAGSYRGRLLDSDGTINILAKLLAEEAEIVAITIMRGGQCGVRIGDERSSVLVSQILPLEGTPPFWGP